MSDATDEPTNPTDEPSAKIAGDLRDLFKQFAQPVLESLDSRLREQVDKRVDDRVDENLGDKVDEILANRLAVLERAVADLDRAVRALQSKLDELSDASST